MHDADALAYMRETQSDALPGTAVIQGISYTTDGMGGYTERWLPVGTVPARLYPQKVRSLDETVAGAQVIAVTRWFVTMPWDTTIDTARRIRMEGRTWEIVSDNSDESWRTALRCEVLAHNHEDRGEYEEASTEGTPMGLLLVLTYAE